MIFKNKGYKSFTHLLFSTTLLFFGLLGCSSNQPKSKPEFTTLTIGILSSSDYYEGLTDYLKREFGNKVQIIIDGGDKLSYEEARKRMINREWDISFTLSPMLSIAAKNNGYTHTGRMFPKNDPYYQAVLFTKADSPIKSISDLNETHTIALGDFNSVSSFYVASYDLYGKTLNVNMGHKSRKIKELVKSGQADLGAAPDSAVKDEKDLRIIHVSKDIPGSGVFLSPRLSKSDREIITKALLNAPKKIREDANYGQGEDYDYSNLIKISERTNEILRCSDFTKNPVNFYCASKPRENTEKASASDIVGKINGWTKRGDTETFKLVGENNQIYEVVIPSPIFNRIPNAPNPIALQGKIVRIIDVQPQKVGEITQINIAEPSQFIVGQNSQFNKKESSQIAYTVKEIEDGDTIVVTDQSSKQTKIRFACIDTPEIPSSFTDNLSLDSRYKNQFLWGNKAKEKLQSLLKVGNQVKLKIVDTDRYGRKVAEVRLPDDTFLQELLLKDGLAMVYHEYLYNCTSPSVLEKAELEAKQKLLNIWSDSEFMAPWSWRSAFRVN
ncbi:nuclease [Cylindrospermopsis raciborskii C04]|uniref:Nuclease n=1 Tax=Cylindrospermopsis raciborskii C07 TaxID=2014886 RepID=A0ABX4WKY7_9CYAN|nr:PhnD/SsuA/transferrin family substrate-binding protein [Cylindrospermopsis raciborskii]PNJ90628.1 nuclease [Cylindrospermopsis raciborskii C04]PNJ92177.1 nuclease [Cylindrospermopsis raciborskii C03]PNJ95742.1 nuclease [Cylindrospermopsis raciborskii C07]